MCGLVGILQREDSGYLDVHTMFKELLYINALRGVDATGILKVQEGESPRVLKKAMPSHDFLDLRKVNHLIGYTSKGYKGWPSSGKAKGYLLLMGHNRAATKGSKTDHNLAHPFEQEGIVLAHNGTINSISKHASDFNGFQVDSEGAAYLIGKYGPVKGLESVNGAFAFTWWDTRTQLLHFLRNDKRPLYFWIDKDGDVMLWASEAAMLELVVARQVGGSIDIDKEFNKWYPEKHQLITFNPRDNLNDFTVENLDIKPYTPPAPTSLPYKGSSSYGKKKESSKRGVPKGFPDKGEEIEFFVNKSEAGITNPGRCIIYGAPLDPDIDINNVKVEVRAYGMTDPDFYVNEVCIGVVSSVYKSTVNNVFQWNIIVDGNTVAVLDEEVSTNNNPEDMIIGPSSVLISINEWMKKTADGCAMCAAQLKIGDADKIFWAGDDFPLCEECGEGWKSDVTKGKANVKH